MNPQPVSLADELRKLVKELAVLQRAALRREESSSLDYFSEELETIHAHAEQLSALLDQHAVAEPDRKHMVESFDKVIPEIEVRAQIVNCILGVWQPEVLMTRLTKEQADFLNKQRIFLRENHVPACECDRCSLVKIINALFAAACRNTIKAPHLRGDGKAFCKRNETS